MTDLPDETPLSFKALREVNPPRLASASTLLQHAPCLAGGLAGNIFGGVKR